MSKNYWKLTDIFASTSALEQRVEELKVQAQNFQMNYEGKLNEIHPQALKEYEEILEGVGAVATYSFLLFAQDSSLGDLYAKYEMICNQIQSYLLFFEIEFCTLSKVEQEEYKKQCPKYAYYLSNLLKSKSHQLTLEQEQVLLEVSPVGIGAFGRFFDEYFSRIKFKFGKDAKRIGEEEILAYLYSLERKERKKAQKVFSKKLNASSHFLTFIFNMVRKDLAIHTKLRKYALPESFRHLSNCTTQKSVDALIDVVEQNFSIVQRYYEVKKEILGLKKLKDYDRYAPIGKEGGEKISYKEALTLVQDSFEEFSSEFANIVKKALQEGWVDSHPKERKRGGAFSHGCVPSVHPYVLLNYTEGRRDVFTIAHEFGHMIHQELSKSQGYLNMDTPLTTAETASVFAEMLLFDTLKTRVSKNELISLYSGKLEDIFSTLFRQIVMTNFERRIHSLNDELKTEEFDRIWKEENQKMFGKSVELSKNYQRWWSYIPHFVHSPFYCYAYSYGQLLVLALFGLYKRSSQEGRRDEFIAQYIEFLSAGGSASPRDLVMKFGFDVENEEFWKIGMQQVQNLLVDFLEILGSRDNV
ncbi:oligoendopeptidase F [Helicobacter cholecystus]|uniref:Oligoendopeptidase F n=1 Tax=Helicobacter cholecystus TaxID=45498 RepID=A0A3D8IX30_9HELI|nr:M3 family oligoendopeptidase [Helicobacter cholecystus]RDU69613.1 oligoendopeptidase F [Helicobacter cholecystus]VEJ24172.1 oligoendopeptidase [Helicobacter cholecystus]